MSAEHGLRQEQVDGSEISLDRLAQKMLALQSEKTKLLHSILSSQVLPTSKSIAVLKECINRSEQDVLMLTALTKAVNAEQLPEFSAEDVERFGQRAAYQAQLRLPWTNARSRENDLQALENRIGKNRLYNEARGGLPVCTTCTSNGNNTVTGHTADCRITRLRPRSSGPRQVGRAPAQPLYGCTAVPYFRCQPSLRLLDCQCPVLT